MQAFICTHTYTCKRHMYTEAYTRSELSLYASLCTKTELMVMSRGDRKKPEQAISLARFMATGNRLIHFMFCRTEKLCIILILNSYH